MRASRICYHLDWTITLLDGPFQMGTLGAASDTAQRAHVSVVNGFVLAPIDGHDLSLQHTVATAQLHKLRTSFVDGRGLRAGNLRWSSNRVPADWSTTSPRNCDQPRIPTYD